MCLCLLIWLGMYEYIAEFVKASQKRPEEGRIPPIQICLAICNPESLILAKDLDPDPT